MSAVVLFEQAAFGTSRFRRPLPWVVGVFDAAVETASAEFVVLTDAVEFEQPVVKTGVGLAVAGADASARIPGDDGLGTRATGEVPTWMSW